MAVSLPARSITNTLLGLSSVIVRRFDIVINTIVRYRKRLQEALLS